MNEEHGSTKEFDFQIADTRNLHPRPFRPLKGALIHASQAKLLSQRARRQSTGRLKSECLDRIADTLQHVCSALERLAHAENDHTEAAERIQPQFAITEEVSPLEVAL